MPIEITSSMNPACIEQLHICAPVLISGIIYVARDATHKQIIETMESGQQLPFEITGQTICYMGPPPARPGHCVGSAGPTTSGRMDAYTLPLLEAGLYVMIGKGPRSHEVKTAMQRCRAVFCAAPGEAGALLSKCIRRNDVIAYPDLRAEALHRIEVDRFPAIVINDIYGGDLDKSGRALFAQEPYCTHDTSR